MCNDIINYAQSRQQAWHVPELTCGRQTQCEQYFGVVERTKRQESHLSLIVGPEPW